MRRFISLIMPPHLRCHAFAADAELSAAATRCAAISIDAPRFSFLFAFFDDELSMLIF